MADWPAALRRAEAEASGAQLPRDLADVATDIGQISVRLKWAGAGVGNAYDAKDNNLVTPALNLLRKAVSAIAAVQIEIEAAIAEIEEMTR